MFGNLISSAIKAVSGFFGGSTTSKPGGGGGGGGWGTSAPVPKAPTIPQLPAFNPGYIAQWGDSKSTISAGIAGNQKLTAKFKADMAAFNEAFAASQAAVAAQQAEIRRIAEKREKERREKQALLDQTVNTLRTSRQNSARAALAELSKTGDPKSWRTYFDDSGNFKGKGTKDSKGFAIPDNWYDETPEYTQMRDAWSSWYNSNEGLSTRVQDEYRTRAQKLIDQTKKAPSGGFLGQLFDKVTFGGTRRALDAREKAAELSKKTADSQTKRFEDMTNSFLAERAKKLQEAQSKKFSSWAEYNKTAADLDAWENDQIENLRYTRAATIGTVEGYEGKATEKLNNTPGKIGNWLQDNVVNGALGKLTGSIWKYTLGQGDQLTPSLTTAPARASNALQNMFRGTGSAIIDKEGNSRGSTGNPWLDSYNQSNFNQQYKGTTFENYALSQYNEMKAKVARGGAAFKSPDELLKGGFDTKNPNFNKAEFERWKAQNADKLQKDWEGSERRGQETFLLANDLALDPLSYTGAFKIPGAVAKTGKFTSSLGEAFKSTKIGSKFLEASSAVKGNKVISWLGKEAKTPEQVLFDTKKSSNAIIDDAQRRLLPQARSRAAQLIQERKILDGKFDDSVLDDFRIMAERGDDQAARWLQQMTDGDFSTAAKIKNWTRAGGMGSNPRLTILKDIADRYSNFSELQRKGDNIEQAATRFGKGKKASFYSPRTKYFDDMENYNFRKFKKNLEPQSAEDLHRGMVDRYFKSDVIDYWGDAQKGKISKKDAEMQRILKEYDESTGGARAAVEDAYKKTQTPLAKTSKFLRNYGPTGIWKKSVLKYRPAWYANNAVYNTQGTALASGMEGVIEQFRLMKPSNYKKALSELPEDVASKVANEIGKGKLSGFGNAVENTSRMGAYRALIAKGYSHEDALKRVNSYLFDYKSTNLEQHIIKPIMPFYSFQKGLTKAAVKMPFDAPAGAIAYNRLDRHQKAEFDKDFNTKVVPEMQKQGYSAEDIEAERNKQAERFAGKLKVGDKYYNTPFNPFSEGGGFGSVNISPWLTTAAEVASSKDHFGRDLVGGDSKLSSRLINKFPVGSFAQTGFKMATEDRTKNWIGAEGSGGYGMTKQAQGYDPAKKNYDRSLDPGASFLQDIGAFFGVPRGTKFDTDALVEQKKMRKLKDEYFATDWKTLPFDEQEKKRDDLFKRFGVTADEFYDGELAKFDSENTKKIKQMKEEAFNKTKALFDEYGKQPQGARGVWATNKLRELVDSGYFASNPFLKGFDWQNPDTIASAYKKMAYDTAKSTGKWSDYNAKYGTVASSQKSLDYAKSKASGDWSAYTAKYGSKFVTSDKKLARDKAVASGDWSEYALKYGTNKTVTPYEYEGKYFKSAESLSKYKEGLFWQRYADANKYDRRQLLKDNPEYNRRSSWSAEMWDDWKITKTAETKRKAAGIGGFTDLMLANLEKNKKSAAPVLFRSSIKGKKKIAFSTR